MLETTQLQYRGSMINAQKKHQKMKIDLENPFFRSPNPQRLGAALLYFLSIDSITN